jgi:hypothetical protein
LPNACRSINYDLFRRLARFNGQDELIEQVEHTLGEQRMESLLGYRYMREDRHLPIHQRRLTEAGHRAINMEELLAAAMNRGDHERIEYWETMIIVNAQNAQAQLLREMRQMREMREMQQAREQDRTEMEGNMRLRESGFLAPIALGGEPVPYPQTLEQRRIEEARQIREALAAEVNARQRAGQMHGQQTSRTTNAQTNGQPPGQTNGHPHGQTNGHTNGQTNGHMNG